MLPEFESSQAHAMFAMSPRREDDDDFDDAEEEELEEDDEFDDQFDDRLAMRVRGLQNVFGLPITGVIDERTAVKAGIEGLVEDAAAF